ncbi:MAG: type III secretion T3S chaperone [Chlamydiia bacterium]|nr:type III secretion T3S chaperone [Chlamydiia bacterium]
MRKVNYPLEQVLEVKRDRVKRQEKVVIEKKKVFEGELEKLKKVEKERNKVLNHKNEKLAQLRKTLDEGSTSPEIQQMKVYLKVVTENLKVEEEKVKKQKEQVKIAEKNLETAKEELRLKRKETDKLEIHKEEWLKVEKKELARKEGIVQDEVGQTIYESQKRKRGKK